MAKGAGTRGTMAPLSPSHIFTTYTCKKNNMQKKNYIEQNLYELKNYNNITNNC